MTDLVASPHVKARDGVEQVADTVVTLMRSFVKARTRMLTMASHDVEWSAHLILKALHTEGPLRSSALAEALHSDPSTVSRQVAGMVKDGLLERRADPEDGRAALLILTGRAREVLAAHDELRIEHYGEVLSDWTDDELINFAGLLRRFTEDYEDGNERWMRGRIVPTTVRPGGTH